MLPHEYLESVATHIWEQCVGLPLTPLRRDLGAKELPTLSGGWSTFTSPLSTDASQHGLGLLVSMPLARRIAAHMFDQHLDDVTPADVDDSLQELTNMLSGNLRGGIEGSPPADSLGIVTARDVAALSPKAKVESVCAFECQGGNVIAVAMSGVHSLIPSTTKAYQELAL